jgi:hypothetical protein
LRACKEFEAKNWEIIDEVNADELRPLLEFREIVDEPRPLLESREIIDDVNVDERRPPLESCQASRNEGKTLIVNVLKFIWCFVGWGYYLGITLVILSFVMLGFVEITHHQENDNYF